MSARGPLTSDRLSGRVAVVFGGGAPGSGVSVGQASALAYAAAGAKLAVVDRKRANAERTTDQIDGSVAIEADVTDDADVERAIGEAVRRFGRIDILHNNVGVPALGAFETFGGRSWQHYMALNCIGAAQTIRFALPHLIEARGAIINISSIASIRYTGMDYAIYNASKAALDQMTVAVALEHAALGVRANAILPGLLDTDMGRALATAGDVEARRRRSPTGAQGDVWDVAHAAVFLASDEARYINGHLLVIDGGLSRRC